MMIMALTVLVYNSGQYLMWAYLKEHNETLPNQFGKEIQTPTLRWVFQMMQGIHVATIPQAGEFVTGINEEKECIIRIFGDATCEIYGLKK